MKNLLASFGAAVLLTACGGGGGGSAEPAASAPAAPWIRYQGSYSSSFDSTRVPNSSTTITLRALPGAADISANRVTRVEGRIGQAAPVVLTAANATDASGHPQYLLDFGPNGPPCTVIGTAVHRPFCEPVPIAITVTDATGFAFTKNIECLQESCGNFGAFSDYGTTAAQFTLASGASLGGTVSRSSRAGYSDTLVPTATAAFAATLPSADGDRLAFQTSTLPAEGTRVRSRFDAGGAFAESTVIVRPNRVTPSVSLECCGPRAAGAELVDIELSANGFLPVTTPGDTYTYSFRITDPATGTQIGSQSGTIFGAATFPLRVRRGHVIEMEVTPNVADLDASAGARLGAAGVETTRVYSNERGTPARFKVYCCSP